jgi:hypothetical protein
MILGAAQTRNYSVDHKDKDNSLVFGYGRTDAICATVRQMVSEAGEGLAANQNIPSCNWNIKLSHYSDPSLQLHVQCSFQNTDSAISAATETTRASRIFIDDKDLSWNSEIVPMDIHEDVRYLVLGICRGLKKARFTLIDIVVDGHVFTVRCFSEKLAAGKQESYGRITIVRGSSKNEIDRVLLAHSSASPSCLKSA